MSMAQARYAQAMDALNRGDWQQAQQFAAQVAVDMPRHGGVHFIAGFAALQLRQLPLAIGHLQRATQYDPGHADYFAQYARALMMNHHLGEALEAADTAMGLSPVDAMTYDTLGVVYSRAYAHSRAIDAFQQAVRLMPDQANFRFNLATSFLHHGDLDAAEREYEACARIAPTYWRVHFALSQLRRQTLESNHVGRVQALLQQHSSNDDAKLQLHLSLAKEFEDFGEYVQAFEHYVQSKTAYRDRIGYSSAKDVGKFDAIRRYFDTTRPDAMAGDDTREPIFIMGMPRSGTTLTDRILCSHSAVYSAGELNNFGAALQRASNKSAYSLEEAIANLGGEFRDWRGLGKAYVDSTRPGTGHTPHFIDKLPHNFLYAGFIANALPNAKMICLRRNPMDTCLSNFRQLFAMDSPNYDYSFDILDTGRYYLQFDRLMKYWQQLLPGRVMEIQYEHLVGDQEDTTRRLLDFCGLPWEDACMHFEQNTAPVSTASAAQVRSGMNRASLERWKRYKAQLVDLRQLLESGGIPIA